MNVLFMLTFRGLWPWITYQGFAGGPLPNFTHPDHHYSRRWTIKRLGRTI